MTWPSAFAIVGFFATIESMAPGRMVMDLRVGVEPARLAEAQPSSNKERA